MGNKPFSIAARFRSFKHAGVGAWTVLTTQHNAWIHAVATIVVCAAGWYFGLAKSDWLWIIVAIITVWVAEAFNTAFEFLADIVSPEFHPKVKLAKDVAAGAVLIAAAGSLVVGLLIFGPHLLRILT